MRSMSDFESLDTDGSNKLDPHELQEFIKKRDGFATKFTIVEASALAHLQINLALLSW